MADEVVDPPAPEKTFTQAELDAAIQARLARVKPEKPADYADLQAKADRLAKLEAEKLTETERLQAERDAAKAATDAANARAEAAEAASKAKDIDTAILLAAAQTVDPKAVLALVSRDAVTIGDDGQVTGADKAVEALLAEKPYLVGTATPPIPTKPKPDPGQGARTSTGTSTDAGRDLYRERHPVKD